MTLPNAIRKPLKIDPFSIEHIDAENFQKAVNTGNARFCLYGNSTLGGWEFKGYFFTIDHVLDNTYLKFKILAPSS